MSEAADCRHSPKTAGMSARSAQADFNMMKIGERGRRVVDRRPREAPEVEMGRVDDRSALGRAVGRGGLSEGNFEPRKSYQLMRATEGR